MQFLGACEPNPCKNGAKCIPNGKSYDCLCPVRFTGPTCASKYKYIIDNVIIIMIIRISSFFSVYTKISLQNTTRLHQHKGKEWN